MGSPSDRRSKDRLQRNSVVNRRGTTPSSLGANYRKRTLRGAGDGCWAAQPPRVTMAKVLLDRVVKLPTWAATWHSGATVSAVTTRPSGETARAPEQPSLNRTPSSPPATAVSRLDGLPIAGLR